MNPDPEPKIEPNGGLDANPFGDPRTYPAGWDTSTLYTLERENRHRNAAPTSTAQSTDFTSKNNEPSSDALS